MEGDVDLFANFKAVIQNHCTSCHGDSGSPFGGIVDFKKLKTQQDWLAARGNLIVPGEPSESSVFYRLTLAKGRVASTNNNMPFPLNGQPTTMTRQEADAIEAYIKSIQIKANPLAGCDQDYAPTSIEMRRLNAQEIRHSISDLFGITSFEILPENTAGQFSNIGRFQTLDESFFEFYSAGVSDVAQKVTQQRASQISNCNRNQNCIQSLLNPIAELAFRKELDNEDLQGLSAVLSKILNHSDYTFSGEEAYSAGLESILLNPQFLFVMRQGENEGERAYTEFELATRISLTLFASIPDRALWEKAKSGELKSNYDAVLDELLESSRFLDRFSTQFSEGWLGFSKLDGFSPEKSAYGVNKSEFEPVANAMKQSVRRTIEHTIAQGLGINSLVNGSQRFVNQDLANHWDIPGSFNSNFRLVNLPETSPYAGTGLLTTTPLVSTSLSDRESIVFRGVQVLGAFVCKVPPPPPEDVVAEIEDSNFPEGTSQRDMLVAHSNNNQCASCHQSFDPYGFGLNAFDGLGRFRLQDQHGNPIDSTGMINTDSFEDHKDLAEILVADNNFQVCMSQTLMTYAMGANIDTVNGQEQSCTVNRIVAEASSDG
ncbi:MAG: DUF1588 domain-containing protein, partial [Pseudomonadota bacterium]